MMSNELNIKQLTVSVKVLKIGRKQCTMSVFNQLPWMNAVFKDTINGMTVYRCGVDQSWQLWGYVRYKNKRIPIISIDDELFKVNMPTYNEINRLYVDKDDEDDLLSFDLFKKFKEQLFKSDQLFIAV